MAASVPVAASPLPPVTGELAGDFTLSAPAGAPKLHWTFAVESAAGGARAVRLALDGSGTRLRAEASLDAADTGDWRVTEGTVELKPWLSGQLAAGTATFTGAGSLRAGQLAGEFDLKVRDLELGELLRFADADQKYFQSASGRVEGVLRLGWRDGRLVLGDSALATAPGAPALILFRPSPGLLTSYVPETVRKHYPGLAAIELGRTELEARVLRLTFYATGDPAGRSAVLRIEGQPHDPKLIAPLVLDVNVSGPVENLVRKLLDSRLKVGAKN